MTRAHALRAVAVGVVLAILTATTFTGMLLGRPLPTIDGHFRLLGLHERAEVLRDVFGVPRIDAGDLHDLFFLQGYVTAQDRFAQMDAMREEAFGVAVGSVPGELGMALEAYAEGVTKFIAQHAAARALPAEIALSGRRPRPWTPRDSLAIAGAYLASPEAIRCVAIDGGRTVRGRPLLWAELFSYAPPPGFYEIGLDAPGARAIGASMPGVPGILAGHNGRVAWSLRQDEPPLDPVDAAHAFVRSLAAANVHDLAEAFGRAPFCAADQHAVAGPTLDNVDRPLDVEWIRAEGFLPRPSEAGAMLVIDLGDLDASKAALSTGQSAHRAAIHYRDQVPLWEAGQLHRLAWTRPAVARTEGQLVLRPR